MFAVGVIALVPSRRLPLITLHTASMSAPLAAIWEKIIKAKGQRSHIQGIYTIPKLH